ncbi:MAG: DJ-1/PfpI family protein [Bacteroidota bacterium]
MPRFLCLALVLALSACQPPDDAPATDASSTPNDVLHTTGENALTAALEARISEAEAAGGRVRRAAFVVTETVYNSELMAPYDVFQHTIYRDEMDYIEPFVVSVDGGPVTTSEGLRVEAHYSYDDAPPVDIVVIPSTEGSMSRDLEDDAYMETLERMIEEAEWVITVCDGAFPLAKTGVLNGRQATTFPGDREALAMLFPEIEVREDVRLVVDGKYVTSVGGAMSYEPAFWLVERLWGAERVAGNAEGLVWPWDLETLPHIVVNRDAALQ